MNTIKKISFKEYLEIDAIDFNGIRLIEKSPAHYKNNNQYDYLELKENSFIHALKYACINHKINDLKEINSISHFGTILKHLKPRDINKIFEIREKFLNYKLIKPVYGKNIEKNYFDCCCLWTDENHNINCKQKIDIILNNGTVIYIMPIRSANELKIKQIVNKYNLAALADYSLNGLKIITKKDYKTFIIIAIEIYPPYEINSFYFSEETLQKANLFNHYNLMKYSHCKSKDNWPGYTDNIKVL